MPDRAVNVAAARSAMGRAYKGSFAGTRPEDLGRKVIEAAPARVPELDPTDIDDIMLGCGQPGGEHRSNISRVISVQMGLGTVPAMTVTRYCSTSIQSLRMAHHAIAAEGDVFVTGGLELESRHRRGSSDFLLPTEAQTLVGGRGHHHGFDDANTRATHLETQIWSDTRERGELPYVYMAMGRTAQNVAGLRGVTARRRTSSPSTPRARGEEARQAGVLEDRHHPGPQRRRRLDHSARPPKETTPCLLTRQSVESNVMSVTDRGFRTAHRGDDHGQGP